MTEVGETRRAEMTPDERFATVFARTGQEKGYFIYYGSNVVDGAETWHALVIPQAEHDALLADVNRERLQAFTERYSTRPDYRPFIPYVKLPRVTIFDQKGFARGKQSRKEALLSS